MTCTPAPAAQTATGSAFDPGNIVSDAVFYNTSAMTVEQIRVFLRAEGEGCTGAYCLKNLSHHHHQPARGSVLRGLPGRDERGRGRRHRQVLDRLRDQPAGHAGDAAEGIRPALRTDPTGVDVQRGLGLALPGHRSRRQRQLRPRLRRVLQPGLRDGQAVVPVQARPGASTTTGPARRSTSCGTSPSPAAARRR